MSFKPEILTLTGIRMLVVVVVPLGLIVTQLLIGKHIVPLGVIVTQLPMEIFIL